jgi:hypothetical protein
MKCASMHSCKYIRQSLVEDKYVNKVLVTRFKERVSKPLMDCHSDTVKVLLNDLTILIMSGGSAAKH